MEKRTENREKRRVALYSVLAALLITGLKTAVGWSTGSLGILSEALHSALDLVAAGITLITVRIATRPADSQHHFGHGKFENLSAMAQTLLLLVTCVWIIFEGIRRLQGGHTEMEVNFWSFAVILFSIVVDYNRSRALGRVARKYNSQALEADALHFSTDIWSSLVVLFGLGMAAFGFFAADAIAALAVAGIVAMVSLRLGRRSVDALLDRTPPGMADKVEAVVRSIPGIRLVHDIRIRTSGPEVFIEMNIHLDRHLTLEQAHAISDEIEAKIREVVPRSHVHVHQEPDP
jgi:cation diffusion facilitator family transporter